MQTEAQQQTTSSLPSDYFADIRPMTKGLTPPSLRQQSPDLLQQLFELKKEIIIPLRFTLKGWSQDLKGRWLPPDESKEPYEPLMNDKGIMWAVQYVEGYLNPAYLLSNFNDEWLKYVMRNVSRDIIKVLCARHTEFGLNAVHLRQVAQIVEHKVLAILLGALNNGFRLFLQEAKQTSELIHRTPDLQGQGLFSGLAGMFKSKKGGI